MPPALVCASWPETAASRTTRTCRAGCRRVPRWRSGRLVDRWQRSSARCLGLVGEIGGRGDDDGDRAALGGGPPPAGSVSPAAARGARGATDGGVPVPAHARAFTGCVATNRSASATRRGWSRVCARRSGSRRSGRWGTDERRRAGRCRGVRVEIAGDDQDGDVRQRVPAGNGRAAARSFGHSRHEPTASSCVAVHAAAENGASEREPIAARALR